ncbi:MAG: hypothetical protein CSA29_00945 [Desulfobacterales bacterium]|nr:MAG: hypothetical protein CSA29_00945 [Desulfobacterales bacterium]
MRKIIFSAITALFLIAGVVQTGYAATVNEVLHNWYFDFEPNDANNGMVPIANYFDLATPNTVDLTIGMNDDFTFVNEGSFAIVQSDGQMLPFNYMGLFTGVYTLYGEGNLVTESVSFTGGTLDLYFGGQQFAEFNLTSGDGAIDQTGAPANNNTFTIFYQSTRLDPGFMFDPYGNDLADLNFVTAFTTTNAVVLANPDPNNPGHDFYLGSNGQIFLTAVPVPSAILLFSCGIIGLVGFVRKER